ncbi:prolipoprotein diacylglyceryl transferase [Treponema primitia ZAS-2]|uniref:Prolipoprotein diacylglyceryl transferase n=1 Tax=Treponema primitia (strain ATCC BAA-887 / DSM 12427 / ZAS-2) TaxID=545694 RepID=F5YH28_TREPZ|nr:prolipoprotein diacylglyceryl transferase family protein [Treponema primitia]AEF86948.1 prolipoprotein diacylglyceryl transferase [Treponema primitia ZAS-2]
MLPYFELFGKTIGLYQIMALCGIFATGICSCTATRKTGHDDNDTISLLLFSAIGVFIGGHLLYGIVNYTYIIYAINNLEKFNSIKIIFDALLVIFGGSVFYGGLLGGIFAGHLYINKNENKKYLLDIVTPAIPLFHFFGRIGCFLGGCCFGIESSIGFTTEHGIVEEANGIQRFPVQLLEALFNVFLFLILAKLRKKGMFKDKMLYIYLLMYSTGRFFIEFLRGDDLRGKWFLLSTSQIISIVLFLSVLIIVRGKKRKFNHITY